MEEARVFFGKDCGSVVCSCVLSPQDGVGRSSVGPPRRPDYFLESVGHRLQVLFMTGKAKGEDGWCRGPARRQRRGACVGMTSAFWFVAECCPASRCAPCGARRQPGEGIREPGLPGGGGSTDGGGRRNHSWRRRGQGAGEGSKDHTEVPHRRATAKCLPRAASRKASRLSISLQLWNWFLSWEEEDK